MSTESDARTLSGPPDRVARHICDEIAARDLQEHDFICKEIDLVERLGVSRPSVREGVARLKALGLVRSSRKKGLTVSKSDPVKVLQQSLLTYARSQESLARLGELRYVLEMGAIGLAVERATPEQVAALAECARRHRDLFPPQTDAQCAEVEEIDRQFHRLILEASHNELVDGMHDVINAFFERSVRELPEAVLLTPDSAWEHLAIADAFAARDVMQAHVILSKHLRRVIQAERNDS